MIVGSVFKVHVFTFKWGTRKSQSTGSWFYSDSAENPNFLCMLQLYLIHKTFYGSGELNGWNEDDDGVEKLYLYSLTAR